MTNKKWFWIVMCLLYVGGFWVIMVEMQNQYERGYAAGADSLSDKHVNEVCIQWLFQSNLEAARRKVCAK